MMLEIATIFVIPFAIALAAGMLAEKWGAGAASGLFSMVGLGLGTYLLGKTLEMIVAH